METRKKILIIDDDVVVRRAVVNALASERTIETATSNSAKEALQRLGNGENFDCLLVDWNMPGLSGLELVTLLRADARYNDTRMMMVTTETSIERVRTALESGADDYLMKPFTKDMLIAKLALLEIDHA